MTDLDPAGLSAAEKALELLHHREPHPLRSSAVREVVRAYLAALPVPSEADRELVARALWEFDGYMEPWHDSERALYFEKADGVLRAFAAGRAVA